MFLLAHRLEGLGYSQWVPSQACAKTIHGGQSVEEEATGQNSKRKDGPRFQCAYSIHAKSHPSRMSIGYQMLLL